jgi:hypothetical protein
MKSNQLRMGMCMVILAVVSPIRAELPIMSDQKWLGYFLGFENKNFRYEIDVKGRTQIKLFGKKGKLLGEDATISINFQVEEIMPDGKFVSKKIMADSLESSQPATNKPKDVVIKGKVTGDAAFEIFVTENRGTISLGGRVTDRGRLTKNPLRFSIKVNFPNAYPESHSITDDKKLKEFENDISKDRLQLLLTDGKRLRKETSETIDSTSKEIRGVQISTAQLEYSSYEGHKFLITALPNSSMVLETTPMKPLFAGLKFTWTADPVKDPEGKSRFTFDVK